MIKIICPFCNEPNFIVKLPVDKGMESCRGCHRAMDILPDGLVSKSNLNKVPNETVVRHQNSRMMCGHNITTGKDK